MELKNSIPDLSLGTVYRNLGVLMQEGRVVSVGKVGGQERYDACTEPHVHFICTSCGRIHDAEISFPLPDYEAYEALTGWRLSTHSLCFNGVCRECIERSQTSHIN